MCRTTARSWAMKRYVSPNSRLELLHQVDDLRLDRDVERRDGLVGDDEVRVDGERTREADSLALPAAELVRVARRRIAREARRSRATRARGVPAFRLPARPCTRSGSPTIRPIAVARVQRRERVLEDHLHPPAQSAKLAFAERRDVPAVEDDLPRRRLVQAEEGPPDRGLAAARLADQSERLAPPDREADVVDGRTSPTWRSRKMPDLIGNQTLRFSTSIRLPSALMRSRSSQPAARPTRSPEQG